MTASPATFTTSCPACGATVTIRPDAAVLAPTPWVLEATCVDAPCRCPLNRAQLAAFRRAAFTAGYV